MQSEVPREEGFPGLCKARDGFTQAHMDVLVAYPGKPSSRGTCTKVSSLNIAPRLNILVREEGCYPVRFR
jgi:hypothetical protein